MFFKICFFFIKLFCYITNHLMNGPLGNSEFCFPRVSMFEILGKQNSLFPSGPVIKCIMQVSLQKQQNLLGCLKTEHWVHSKKQSPPRKSSELSGFGQYRKTRASDLPKTMSKTVRAYAAKKKRNGYDQYY